MKSGKSGRWLKEYNSERLHGVLNILMPEEYRLIVENPEISKIILN
ncbi:ISBp1, transposase B [Erwinia sp. Ejp617]|nr:ISBp1, transposase B [Erwinia sp. Ejp617]